VIVELLQQGPRCRRRVARSGLSAWQDGLLPQAFQRAGDRGGGGKLGGHIPHERSKGEGSALFFAPPTVNRIRR